MNMDEDDKEEEEEKEEDRDRYGGQPWSSAIKMKRCPQCIHCCNF